jgi:hypothetical protein
MNFQRTMEVLAGYMTSFGCGVIPRGDMVTACIDSREGACRHRALAFMVCASVMGIPTRYCCSDCHAYVEVFFPNIKRWVGIDLGGCSPPQPESTLPTGEDLMTKFRNKLVAMGWHEDEDRFRIAIQGAEMLA